MKSIIRGCLLFLCAVSLAQAKVVSQELDYKSGDTVLKGFIAFDDAIKGKRPGVLVVHEWWGHNDYARKRATQLAEMGYVALAVDMYGDGKQAAHPDDAKKFSSEIAQNMDVGKARFMAAMETLKQNKATDVDKIAAIGYCFGGAVVLQMAREGVDLDGVVSFHGSLGTSSPAKPGVVKARVLVAHGAEDPFIPGEHILGFIDEMNTAKADYQLMVYSGAKHSFTNPAANQFGAKFSLPLEYSKKADEASWADMQRFFEEIF
ncbi:dienelactone hydrolase family protein [Pseudomonadota bacterium]